MRRGAGRLPVDPHFRAASRWRLGYDPAMGMLRSAVVVAILAVGVLLLPSIAEGAVLPPSPRCTTHTLKTVKKGDRQSRAERWFTRRLHRAGCLDRRNPAPRFRPFSKQCKAKNRHIDAYYGTLLEGFLERLNGLLLANQPRLLRLDQKELSLLQRRRGLRQKAGRSGRAKRQRLQRRIDRINRQLVTVRTKRARINHRMNAKAITRRGAASVWLGLFDGEVSGCVKPFRNSPYLVTMRKYFLLQLAARDRVTPPPTRRQMATWGEVLSLRGLFDRQGN